MLVLPLDLLNKCYRSVGRDQELSGFGQGTEFMFVGDWAHFIYFPGNCFVTSCFCLISGLCLWDERRLLHVQVHVPGSSNKKYTLPWYKNQQIN